MSGTGDFGIPRYAEEATATNARKFAWTAQCGEGHL